MDTTRGVHSRDLSSKWMAERGSATIAAPVHEPCGELDELLSRAERIQRDLLVQAQPNAKEEDVQCDFNWNDKANEAELAQLIRAEEKIQEDLRANIIKSVEQREAVANAEKEILSELEIARCALEKQIQRMQDPLRSPYSLEELTGPWLQLDASSSTHMGVAVLRWGFEEAKAHLAARRTEVEIWGIDRAGLSSLLDTGSGRSHWSTVWQGHATMALVELDATMTGCCSSKPLARRLLAAHSGDATVPAPFSVHGLHSLPAAIVIRVRLHGSASWGAQTVAGAWSPWTLLMVNAQGKAPVMALDQGVTAQAIGTNIAIQPWRLEH